MTSLRFFAAFLVVLYHAAHHSSPDESNPFAVLRFGYLGVTFFFVLSGFVLVWSARDGDRVGAFYRRRFARVWPLHALTFVAAAVLAVTGLVAQRGAAWTAIPNLALLQAWSADPEVAYSFNGVSWSLSDEALFYAAFPVLYLVGRRIGGRAMLAIGVGWLAGGGWLLELLGAPEQFVSTHPLYKVGEFAVGMGAALLLRAGKVPAIRVPPRLAVALLLGSYAGAAVLNRMSAGWLAQRTWLVALIVLPGVVLVLLAYARRDLDGGSGLLTRPLMVRLGQWSFALYLVHELVLRAARPLMLEHAWTVPVAIVLAIVLAGALYEWFERPMERRLRGRSRPAVQLEGIRA